MIAEGFDELSQNLGQLKMEASDGKKYLTDVANAKTLLRIIQSIPGDLFKINLLLNKEGQLPVTQEKH